jgi:septum formation protein
MVTFKKLDDRAIGRYLDATEYMDKAGAYAIQQNGDMIVQTVAGSITNVIGFPLRLFYSMLIKSGLEHILTPLCGLK